MGKSWALISHLHTIAGPSITLLYPLYASICAIESPSKLDDEQWLAYWILYSFITLVEMVAEPVLDWIPMWYQIKVLFVAWLVLPQFKGASFIYEKFVREKLKKYRAKMGHDVGAHHSHVVKGGIMLIEEASLDEKLMRTAIVYSLSLWLLFVSCALCKN